MNESPLCLGVFWAILTYIPALVVFFFAEYLDRYNDWVSRVVPEEKIVWMEMKDEWGPLCKMLDKPKPDLPFPRANDAEAAEGLIREKVKKATFIWSGIIGAIAISAAVAHRIYRHT